MKQFILLLTAISFCFNASYAGKPPVTAPYEDFIKTVDTSPVDYIFELFEKYDIVIISERDYRDVTQYHLIASILEDERFRMVSDVMCEVGSNNHTDGANRFINTRFDSDESRYRGAMDFIKDMTYWPLWNSTNFVRFLSCLNLYNNRSADADKLNLTLLDIPFDWNDPAVGHYNGYWSYCKKLLPQRADIMADNFKGAFEKSSKGKALVILASPQSYRTYNSKKLENTAAQHIFDAYPGRVANVFLNWAKLNNFSVDDKLDKMIDGGAWDKAFENCGCPEVGFDLAGTPFGATKFKDMLKAPGGTTYKDVFTGMIYYKGPLEWTSETGFEYKFDKSFEDEFVRRLTIVRKAEDDTRYRAVYGKATHHTVYHIYLKNKKMMTLLDRRPVGYGKFSKNRNYLMYYLGDEIDIED